MQQLHPWRLARWLVGVFLCACAVPGSVVAAEYPDRPIRLVVPFPAGNGTTSHLAGELFRTMAGIDIVHVPYRGGAPAMTDVIAGQVQMMIDVMPNAYPLAKSGKVRGLACTTARRFPAAPEYPTIAESGVPGYDVTAWDAIFAPAGTPVQVIDRLNAAIRQALEDPKVAQSLLTHGAQAIPGTPSELAQHVASEADKWAKVVRRSGAKID